MNGESVSETTQNRSGSVRAMTSESSTTADSGSDGGGRVLTLVSIIVLVAGLALLGVFGVRYVIDRSAVNTVVSEREAATVVASEVVENVFGFHYEDVDASLTRLEEMSTGNFLTEQREFSEAVKERVEEQQAVVTATISNTAVSELDVDEGTASVLVVFTATSEREGEEDIVRRQSSVVELLWEDDRWKAAEVMQVGVSVPVGASSESVAALEGSLGGSDSDAGAADDADEADEAGDGEGP